MDDLMKCLYQFAMEKRMGSLHEDDEYKEAAFDADIQEDRLEETLDPDQKKELNRLMDKLVAKNAIADEHIFRAALELFKELNGLVRA